MKRLITALMTAALLYGCTSGRRTVAPVNPEASPEARQLLEFLYSIRGKYTLAGQHNFLALGRVPDQRPLDRNFATEPGR